ncbi:MAG: hypothetical protein QI197_04840 [Candidatus Korarchaeota archaeon]|nr:hypothetical protein [Candidatus Korarchaeota archaeon]
MRMVVDLLEQLLAATVLLIASAFDLLNREVPDWVWIPGLVGGAVLRILDPGRTLSYLEVAWPIIIVLVIMLLAEWLLSASGEADLLAYLTLALISTEPYLYLPPSFLVYLLSKLLLVMVLPFQFVINLARVSRRPELLREFDEPLHRRVLALFLLSPYSKHLAVGARIAEVREDGRRRFILRAALAPLERSEIREEGEGMWIAPTYPFIPFILAAYVIVQLLCLWLPLAPPSPPPLACRSSP